VLTSSVLCAALCLQHSIDHVEDLCMLFPEGRWYIILNHFSIQSLQVFLHSWEVWLHIGFVSIFMVWKHFLADLFRVVTFLRSGQVITYTVIITSINTCKRGFQDHVVCQEITGSRKGKLW